MPLAGRVEHGHPYRLCFFDEDPGFPQVHFLDAENDEEALSLVRSMKPWLTREVWDEDRLVRVFTPTA